MRGVILGKIRIKGFSFLDKGAFVFHYKEGKSFGIIAHFRKIDGLSPLAYF